MVFSVHNASRIDSLQDKQEPLGSETVEQEEANQRKRPTAYLLTQKVLLSEHNSIIEYVILVPIFVTIPVPFTSNFLLLDLNLHLRRFWRFIPDKLNCRS